VFKLERILASRNAVAMDSVMAMMAGLKPDRVPTNRVAAERGLGPARTDGIEIVGDFEPIRGFRLPSAWLAEGLTGIAGVTFYRLVQRRPLANRALCTRCRRCADNCPVQAIEMNPFPAIARGRCINCYCCVEICPERALGVPSAIRSLLRSLSGH